MIFIPPAKHSRTAMEQRVVEMLGRQIRVTVRRNPRARRLILRIAIASGDVAVTVPRSAALAEGFALVESRAGWVIAGLARLGPPVPFADGAEIPVGGRPLRIRHQPGGRCAARRLADDLVVNGPSSAIPAAVERWLRAEAAAVIADLVADKAARIGRAPGRISLRDTRSRWGSCSARGDLSFSWRLILAPPMVLDYVVGHEVAHLVDRGHGPNFWRTVASLVADMKAPTLWLRRQGHTLLRYGAAEPVA